MNLVLLTAATTTWTICCMVISVVMYQNIPPLTYGRGQWTAFWAVVLWLWTSVGALWVVVGRMA